MAAAIIRRMMTLPIRASLFLLNRFHASVLKRLVRFLYVIFFSMEASLVSYSRVYEGIENIRNEIAHENQNRRKQSQTH